MLGRFFSKPYSTYHVLGSNTVCVHDGMLGNTFAMTCAFCETPCLKTHHSKYPKFTSTNGIENESDHMHILYRQKVFISINFRYFR